MNIHYVNATPELQEQYKRLSSANTTDFIRFEEHYLSVVALDGEQPVGLIVAKRRYLSPPLDTVLEAYIDLIEVLPAYQRQGIGTALVERVIQWATECQAAQVRAWSDQIRREALMLWHKMGFTFSRVDRQDGDKKWHGFYVAKRL